MGGFKEWWDKAKDKLTNKETYLDSTCGVLVTRENCHKAHEGINKAIGTGEKLVDKGLDTASFLADNLWWILPATGVVVLLIVFRPGGGGRTVVIRQPAAPVAP